MEVQRVTPALRNRARRLLPEDRGRHGHRFYNNKAVWPFFGGRLVLEKGGYINPRLRRHRLAAKAWPATHKNGWRQESYEQDIFPRTTTASSIASVGRRWWHLADRLTRQGVDVVILEAGKHHTQDVSRTTSGRCSPRSRGSTTHLGRWLASHRNLSQPAGVDRQGRWWVTMHWSAWRCASWSTNSRPAPPTAMCRVRTCLDWPISCESSRPYYEVVERKMGVAGTKAMVFPDAAQQPLQR